jgi:hypothetical protein
VGVKVNKGVKVPELNVPHKPDMVVVIPEIVALLLKIENVPA